MKKKNEINDGKLTTNIYINDKENKHKLLGSYEPIFFTVEIIKGKDIIEKRSVYPDVSFANVNNVMRIIDNLKKKIEIKGIDKEEVISFFFKDKEDIAILQKAHYVTISQIFTEIYKYLGLYDKSAILELSQKVEEELRREVDDSKK